MNAERIVGPLTTDETAELAKECLANMTDDEKIQLIREACLDDQVFADELYEEVQGLVGLAP